MLARDILKVGAQFGWGWATVRRAKENVDARSLKKGNEWWWFDPKTCSPASIPAATMVANDPAPKMLPEVAGMADAVKQLKLQQGPPTVAEKRAEFQNPNRNTYGINDPANSFQNTTKAIVSPAPRQPTEPALSNPIAPVKPRRVRIWENEVKERRDALISAAGFTDLYIMRADIRLRQEQLHAKGLLKEELALNDLLFRVNEALEKKKEDEKIEVNQQTCMVPGPDSV
jgi:hypothetical protein